MARIIETYQTIIVQVEDDGEVNLSYSVEKAYDHLRSIYKNDYTSWRYFGHKFVNNMWNLEFRRKL